MIQAERVITRDVSSGMHHLRIRVNGHLYVQEMCNTDAAGAYSIVADLPEDIESAKFCKSCFSELHDARPTTEY